MKLSMISMVTKGQFNVEYLLVLSKARLTSFWSWKFLSLFYLFFEMINLDVEYSANIYICPLLILFSGIQSTGRGGGVEGVIHWLKDLIGVACGLNIVDYNNKMGYPLLTVRVKSIFVVKKTTKNIHSKLGTGTAFRIYFCIIIWFNFYFVSLFSYSIPGYL